MEYIAAHRGNTSLDRVEPEYRQLCTGFWARIHDSATELIGECATTQLLVCRSVVARAETVVVDDGVFVVYDQYLGRIFAQLTRLVRNDSSLKVVENYLHKLYALRLLAAGKEDHACFQAMLYAATHRNADSRPKDRELWRSVEVQERFILAHEFVHSLFRTSPPQAMRFAQYYEHAAEVGAKSVDRMRKRESREDAADRHLSEWRAAMDAYWLRNGGHPSSIVRDPALEHQARMSFLKFYDDSATHTKLLEAGLRDERVREEAVCDGIATYLTLIEAKHLGLTVVEVIGACYMALHNLRLMRYLDVLALHGPAADPDLLLRTNAESHMRLSLLRCFADGNLYLAMLERSRDSWMLELWHYLDRIDDEFKRVIYLHTLMFAAEDMWMDIFDDPTLIDHLSSVDRHAETQRLCGVYMNINPQGRTRFSDPTV